MSPPYVRAPESFAAFEYAGWQRAAPLYESTWAGLTRQFIEPLLAAAGVRAGTRTLDVACGPGYVVESARRRGARVIGLDFSPEMAALARTRNPGIDIHLGDAHALPFADSTFHAVVINFGVLHFSEPERALGEAARVLAPRGRCAFTVWADPDESEGARFIESVLERYANRDVGLPNGPDRYGAGGPNEARQMLERCGFRGETVSYERAYGEWLMPSPDFVFKAERYAGVRTAGLLRRQTSEALAAIKLALDEGVQRFRTERGYAIPYTALVIAAER